MAKKKPTKAKPGPKAATVCLAPLSMDEAVDAIFAIKAKDVKRIVESRPGKKK